MKYSIILMAFIASNTVNAKSVEDIEKEIPKFRWDHESYLSVDISNDGKEDAAYIGYSDDTAAVAVIDGATSKITYVDFFIGNNDTQRAICGTKAKLVVEKQKYSLAESMGANPKGYEFCESCIGIAVDDGAECDPIHIYWNHVDGFVWWWRM